MEPVDRMQKEALAEQYVDQNKPEAAVRLLYELIAEYAGDKDFKKAEALHDRMYEVDPLALSEIVRAGEIIEAEKSEDLDPEQIELWPDLYGSLSTAEANALYYAMTPLAFAPGDTIMAQGELNQKLYFILGGEISCIYKLEETEYFVSSLGAGDIMGQAGFFSATVCTVTLKARSRVSACYLQREQREEWKGEFPALEAKLEEYCRRKDRIRHDLEKRAIERRVHRRLPLSGRMRFQLLNKSEEPLAGAYKGEIEDISPGGLSLLVRSTRADALYTLLGRRVRVGFELPLRSGKHRKLQETMTVIAVEARLFDDYSVHLKFDRRREDRFIEDIDPDKPVLPLK